jgi:hypothetical protein
MGFEVRETEKVPRSLKFLIARSSVCELHSNISKERVKIQYCEGYEVTEDEIGGACKAHRGDGNCVHYLLESLKGRHHSEDLGVDEKIILKWTLGKLCLWLWNLFILLWTGTSDGLLSDSIKGEKCFDQLSILFVSFSRRTLPHGVNYFQIKPRSGCCSRTTD